MEKNSNAFLRWHILPLLVRFFFPLREPITGRLVRKVACLRPGKLGDMIVATPLFSALKKQGGIEHLAVLCSAANEVVVRHNPHLDMLRIVNFHRIADIIRTIGWLRRQRFDAIMDLTPGFSRTNFLMSYYAGPGTLRVGIEKEIIADCYHFHVGNRETPLADRILDAGELLTGSRFERHRRFEIYTAPDDKEAAAQFVNRHKGKGPLIGINLSAGSGSRQWAYDRFAGLVSLLSARTHGTTMALIAIGQQRQWAEGLAAAHPACIAAPQFSFLTITELIGACSLLISPDTALIHVAASRGVPVVGLYTSHAENFARWAPYQEGCAVIQSANTASINDISPEAVCEKTLTLLQNVRA